MSVRSAIQLCTYGIASGFIIGAISTREMSSLPTSSDPAVMELVALAVFPVLSVVWIRLSRWTVFAAVATVLIAELAVDHMVGCYANKDCFNTTLAGIALGFVYLYPTISMPLAFFLWSELRRDLRV